MCNLGGVYSGGFDGRCVSEDEGDVDVCTSIELDGDGSAGGVITIQRDRDYTDHWDVVARLRTRGRSDEAIRDLIRRRTLSIVSDPTNNGVAELKCGLSPGEHLTGSEIFDLRAIRHRRRFPDGRPADLVDVVFRTRAAAEAEKQPLLDLGIGVLYDEDGRRKRMG